MKYLFFGASVTEQSRNHATGEITGFYPLLEEQLPGQVDRVSAGSCSIHDAGILLLDDVIRLQPDVVFLEWCTALRIDRDLSIVHYILKTLGSAGIAAVPLLLPRRDRDNESTELALDLIQTANALGCPSIDLTYLRDSTESTILRDVVHTNPKGAKLYAAAIKERIQSETFYIPLRNELLSLSSAIPPTDIHVSTVGGKTSSPYAITTKRISLVVTADANSIGSGSALVSLYADVRVGPWSGKITVSVSDESSFEVDMFDRWCYRERQCIKRLTPDISAAALPTVITLVVSDERPSLAGMPKEHQLAFAPFKPTLKIRGRIYAVCSQPGFNFEVRDW